MKELILINSDKTVLVDDEDYFRLTQYVWYLIKSRGGSFQIIRTKYFDSETINFNLGSEILNTRQTVDHKDRNVFNSQKRNLRIATASQNAANRTKGKYGTSKYKGVRKVDTGWEARISFKKRTIQIGTFKTDTEAALQYNIKAKQIHGEFAVLNVI